MSIYRVSVLKLWRNTEKSEQKRILAQFIKKNGDYYSKDEFLDYLEKKYRSSLSLFTLPVTSREQEH